MEFALQIVLVVTSLLVILLVLLGAVFTTSPAGLIARLTPEWMNTGVGGGVILIYYLLATLLPIDKLIGKLYPIFGAVLLTMAVGIIVGLIAGGYQLPELTLALSPFLRLPYSNLQFLLESRDPNQRRDSLIKAMIRSIAGEKDEISNFPEERF